MIHVGDCLEVLCTIADNSVDSIVTDPPYGLSFMGKRWDYDAPSTQVWVECLRVLKPGGYLLAFAGTRTQHRMAVRIEDAGFEIRDMIAWVYGSGFPKSHNGPWGGTALKPALEPITLARKPPNGTVAANFAAHGVGGLHIDDCRVPPTGESRSREHEAADRRAGMGSTTLAAAAGAFRGGSPDGRWPANLIHDGSEEVLALFPDSVARDGANKGVGTQTVNCYGKFDPAHIRTSFHRRETGSAARFFYCAKASRRDRDDGLEALARQSAGMVSNTSGQHMTRRDQGYEVAPRANNHPTVKPTELMRYLCRLVTPPGGLVLDPFMGSGSTGKAAALEGLDFIGIEREPEYVAIAEARITWAKSWKVEADATPQQHGLDFESAA